jgi:hypothetical protein
VNSETTSEKRRIEKWLIRNQEILDYVHQRELKFVEDAGTDTDDEDEDVVSQEELEAAAKLDRDEYNVEDMLSETFSDLDQLMQFLTEARKFEPKNDDKLQELIRLLRKKDLAQHKVLIFTEFADTARYLKQQLKVAGLKAVEEVDSGSKFEGGTKSGRASLIKRFSPYYNDSSSPRLKAEGLEEIQVFISTDVLSEGLNLQDASRMINYDIHWNPVRLMQRIGRVDRRLSPDIEEQLKHDHPEMATARGKVMFWNFLPPDELNRILSLYSTVTKKTLLISKTLGIEGKKLLRPEDDYEALRAYEGDKSVMEAMHLEYQALIQADPELEGRLDKFPGAVFSGKEALPKGIRGVFFCYALPALDKEQGEWTEYAGTTRWYFVDLAKDAILEEPSQFVAHIRSDTSTPRTVKMEEATLFELRVRIEKHIKLRSSVGWN